MGGGSSVSGEFSGLSPEQQKKLRLKFNELIAEGKSEEEAILWLKQAAATTAPEAVMAVSGIITVELIDLMSTIELSINNGKTPLIIDNSEDNKVDTFFRYRSTVIIDGKKMGLDKTMRKTPVADIMEDARSKLVAALKLGTPVVVALTKSVTDFATTFSDEACYRAEDKQGLDFQGGKQAFFPLSVFQNAGRGLIKEEMLNALFTEEDKNDSHGVAICRDEKTFHVVVTSQFSPEDFEEYLFGNEWGLPKPKSWYQFIVIKPEKS